MTEFIRAIVRPILLLGWLGITAVLLLQRIPVPDWWIVMGSMGWAWWFAGRKGKEVPNGG